MKARLLKNLRKDAEYAITIEYAYPMYVVTLNMAGFTTNGIIKERFTELEKGNGLCGKPTQGLHIKHCKNKPNRRKKNNVR